MRFCAEYSRASEEQLFGTAKPVDHWLLIEHLGRWEKEAEGSLPSCARDAVARLKSRVPRLRVALIRQDARTPRPLLGFLAQSRETQSRLFSFSFENHTDLADLDIGRILETPPIERDLYLVCTHGTHDRCCAKFGNALFDAMRRVAGADVWRTSHVGGCRFAPNLVALPRGIVYGRVQAEDCPSIVEAARAGGIVTRLLRGRSCYDQPVQAAEYFIRSELRETGALQLGSSHELDGEWNVVFHRGKTVISVRLAVENPGISTFKSCAATILSSRTEFRLVSFSSDESRVATETVLDTPF